eukprot:2450566-Lingulodinium_polyedra.AAC.1
MPRPGMVQTGARRAMVGALRTLRAPASAYDCCCTCPAAGYCPHGLGDQPRLVHVPARGTGLSPRPLAYCDGL